MMGSSGYGSASRRYLDPDRVFALVRGRRHDDLFDYLASVDGAGADLRCLLVSFAGTAVAGSPPWLDEDSWALHWAKYAWAHATISRLTAPQVAGNPFSYPSDPVLRHAAIINQLDASSSSTTTAMLPPQQTNYNAGTNFPITVAPTLDRISDYNLGRHISDFASWGTDSTLDLALAKLSLDQPGFEQMAPQGLMQNNHGTHAMGLSSLRQPQSAQPIPRWPMQNEEVDIKEKGPASEVDEEKVLVNVATIMEKDGTTGAAGLLIKKGTRQFLCASYFQMRATEPVLLAAACCEGIKIAQAYQPHTIVLESHLFHLLEPLVHAHPSYPQMEELKKLMKSMEPLRCTVETITEECNLNACQLALYCMVNGVADIFFGAPPNWITLT